MYPCPVISRQERDEFTRFWTAQRDAVEKEVVAGRVSSDCVRWFYILTAIGNIGYDWDQIRPGKLGQWDVYFSLVSRDKNILKAQALICSGLTETEVATEERLDLLREGGIDPDNAAEVAEFERIECMTPLERDAEIARLEKLLGR